ncbi:MAG: response regulator [Kofleriaceae bacterium]|nr:response regulator [Kofleriaceae bacterium]
MKEVSCRYFDILLRDLRERGVDPRRLVEGTPYTARDLAKKDERVEWTALVRMMENARSLWTRDQLLRLGERSTEGPLVQFIGVVARIRFSVAGFYQWVTAETGVASQMITCVKTSSRVLGPGRIAVEFKMSRGFAPSEEFFLITQGTYAAMPRMVGAPRATVTSEMRPDGARFLIQYTEPKGIIPSVRRFVTAPFTMRQAATEIADAHSSLLARYQELDTARAEIERQHELLDIAYQLGQQVWRERDLAKIARSVVTGLRSSFGGVRVTLETGAGISAEDGTCSGPPRISASLPGSSSTGRLDVWGDSTLDDAKRLVDLVAPTIALAIDNAVAYQELADYQAGLEKLVDQRTTELRAARDELAGLVEQLREAMASRERFFGNISHEIRTPLTLILLATGDIEKRAGALLDERARAGLGSITDGARKLLRLVDELLLLAAGQADKLVLAPQPTDVRAMFVQILAAWRPAAEAAGLALDGKFAETRFLSLDPVAIERVASNLISNAVKYTPSGGSVEIELGLDGDSVWFAVRDTGRGIDDELAKRLFGRFERASGDDRRKAGTGIGLALVKQLVDGHHGKVAVKPRPTGGTEFVVTLPRIDAMPIERTGPSPQLTPSQIGRLPKIRSGATFTPPGTSQGVIVIAEDEPRLAQAIAELLSDQYTVIVGLDGAAALELVKKHQPQLLITDVDMPVMNGIELSRKFREITGDRLAPIVILSAVVDMRTRVMGLEAGAIDYVPKPFDPHELKARVAAQFRMRDLALRLHRAEQLSAMGILTSGLAHELRNPANGIVNALAPITELLPPDVGGPETPVGQLLDVMKQCAEQIAFLTRQLLGFRNNAELDLRPAEIPGLVQRALKLANSALSGIDVRTNLALGGPILCSAPLLLQVLTNLIENAGHAAGKGGWVEVHGTLGHDGVTIEISDSGPGVPVELRERVFEPFFTTKPPGQGTGLGLSVARTIVHRHRGTLEIHPKGDGTAFVIRLPGEANRVAEPKCA